MKFVSITIYLARVDVAFSTDFMLINCELKFEGAYIPVLHAISLSLSKLCKLFS
jgi:hypothetical protein